jgi:hypothetical protein
MELWAHNIENSPHRCSFNISSPMPGAVAQVIKPSYLEGRDWEDGGSLNQGQKLEAKAKSS